jgi:hypothetical protein
LPAPESTVWFRLDGVAINGPGTGLVTGEPLLAPLNLTSKGRYLGFYQPVATGTRTPMSAATAADVCGDWTTPNGLARAGTLSRVGEWWSRPDSIIGCTTGAPIYCFEI